MNLLMKSPERNKKSVNSINRSLVYIFCIPSRDSGPTPIPYLSDGKYYELSRFDKNDWTWFITSKSKVFSEEEFEEITDLLNKIISHPLYLSVLPIMSEPHDLYQTRKVLRRLDCDYEIKSGTFLCDERKEELVSNISNIFSKFINDEMDTVIISWFFLNNKNFFKMAEAIKEIVKIKKQSNKMINNEIIDKAVLLAKAKVVNQS